MKTSTTFRESGAASHQLATFACGRKFGAAERVTAQFSPLIWELPHPYLQRRTVVRKPALAQARGCRSSLPMRLPGSDVETKPMERRGLPSTDPTDSWSNHLTVSSPITNTASATKIIKSYQRAGHLNDYQVKPPSPQCLHPRFEAHSSSHSRIVQSLTAFPRSLQQCHTNLGGN
jgi:hypothetical protein